MNVGDICVRDTVTIRPFDELAAAARLMRDQHVGYLVVVEPAAQEGAFKPAGVLTDRDIVVSVVAKDSDANFLRTGDVMTRDPVVAQEDESLGSALKKMRQVGVRRLPVVGDYGQLVGVLALDDIIDALVGELEDVAGAVRTEQMLEHTLRP